MKGDTFLAVCLEQLREHGQNEERGDGNGDDDTKDNEDLVVEDTVEDEDEDSRALGTFIKLIRPQQFRGSGGMTL